MKLLNIVELDSCESTNDEAWKLIPRDGGAGDVDFVPTVVVSHRQNKGRGRQGRVWQSGIEGNIFVSLAMPAPDKNLGWLPLAAGVAAVEAITHACALAGCVGLEPLHLKWPNDILWDTAKMGGILCESRFVGDRPLGAVVGLGLNVVTAPEIEGMNTASLVQHVIAPAKQSTDPTLIAAMRWFLIREWSLRLLSLATELSEGNTERLRGAWKQHAHLDKFPKLTVHDRSGEVIKLEALDLSADGKLKAAAGTKIVFLDQADAI